MAKKKPKLYQSGANPERVRADQERRRSGAAGTHKQTDSRQETKRKSIRFDVKATGHDGSLYFCQG